MKFHRRIGRAGNLLLTRPKRAALIAPRSSSSFFLFFLGGIFKGLNTKYLKAIYCNSSKLDGRRDTVVSYLLWYKIGMQLSAVGGHGHERRKHDGQTVQHLGHDPVSLSRKDRERSGFSRTCSGTGLAVLNSMEWNWNFIRVSFPQPVTIKFASPSSTSAHTHIIVFGRSEIQKQAGRKVSPLWPLCKKFSLRTITQHTESNFLRKETHNHACWPQDYRYHLQGKGRTLRVVGILSPSFDRRSQGTKNETDVAVVLDDACCCIRVFLHMVLYDFLFLSS